MDAGEEHRRCNGAAKTCADEHVLVGLERRKEVVGEGRHRSTPQLKGPPLRDAAVAARALRRGGQTGRGGRTMREVGPRACES